MKTKDSVAFEIAWLENDGKWILRIMHNKRCVLAPRENSVADCLATANNYCNEIKDSIKDKVTITINYN